MKAIESNVGEEGRVRRDKLSEIEETRPSASAKKNSRLREFILSEPDHLPEPQAVADLQIIVRLLHQERAPS